MDLDGGGSVDFDECVRPPRLYTGLAVESSDTDSSQIPDDREADES